MDNYWNRIQERAYYKYLDRKRAGMRDDSYKDWTDASREEFIENKIEEEAYLNFAKGYNDPYQNWEFARKDVEERIKFLAFYLHESNINKTPMENWIEAQQIYIENF